MLSKDHHCLEAILKAIDRIIEYTSEFKSADDFNNDHLNFDATMMNFIVMGEMVDKLSEAFKNTTVPNPYKVSCSAFATTFTRA